MKSRAKKRTVLIIVLALSISLVLFTNECKNVARTYNVFTTRSIEDLKIRKFFDFESIEDISKKYDLPLEDFVAKLENYFENIDEKLSIRKFARENKISRSELKEIFDNIFDFFEDQK